MNESTDSNPARPFFLETDSGRCFCIYYPPCSGKSFSGTFLYIHPLGDEMNKTRHMVALQARAFSNLGYGVLQIDLFGCGDSYGEFSESRWNIWKQDILCALRWIKENTSSGHVNLWGLRLGALLTLDFVRDFNSDFNIQNIVLWQPILNGQSYVTQFLRMNLVNNFYSNDSQSPHSVNELRKLSSAGKILEVAGYEVAPELIEAIDHLKLSEIVATQGEIHWFDIVSDMAQSNTPVKSKIIDTWKKENDHLYFHPIIGPFFWATQEIVECPQLLVETTKVFTKYYAV